MTTSKINLLGFFLIVAEFTATNAEVDCGQRPPHVDFKSCCDFSTMISDEIKEKCGFKPAALEGGDNDIHPHESFGHPHGPPGHHHGPPGHRGGWHGRHQPCFASCALNETGILVDDELNEDNMNSYLEKVFDDSIKVEFLSNKFMYCNEKRKEFDSHMYDRHGPSCDSKHGGMLIGCVFMESFMECPESVWSNTDECNAVRDHFKQCVLQGNFDVQKKEEDEGVEEI